MQRSEIIALAVSIVAVLVLGTVVYLLSGSGGKRIEGARRFTAAPGTQRETARAITSPKAAPSKGTSSGSKKHVDSWGSLGGEDEPGETIERPGGDEGKVDASPEVRVEPSVPRAPADIERERVIQEALSAIDPYRAIRQLEAFAQRAEQAHAASQIYTALGRLYTKVEPPDIPRAEFAFNLAMDKAGSAEDLEEAAFAAAAMYQTENRPGDAISQIERALKENPVSVRSLQLRIILGGLQNERGNRTAARDAYRAAVNVYEEHEETLAPEGTVFYAQACQMLARYFRIEGDDSTADAIVDRYKSRVSPAAG